MSTSALLIVLHLEFDALALSAAAGQRAAQCLRELAERFDGKALFLAHNDLTCTVAAEANQVVDHLGAIYQKLIHPEIKNSFYGLILSATVSVTATGKTISQRSLARVRETVRSSGVGKVCIASQTLQLLAYFSASHAACFDKKNAVQSASLGTLAVFSPVLMPGHSVGSLTAFIADNAMLPPPGAQRDALMESIEKTLSAYLGPMTHLLVGRSNALAGNWKEVVFMLTKDLQPEMVEPCKRALEETWQRYQSKHNASS